MRCPECRCKIYRASKDGFRCRRGHLVPFSVLQQWQEGMEKRYGPVPRDVARNPIITNVPIQEITAEPIRAITTEPVKKITKPKRMGA
jgi:hypothetical protein